MLVTKTCKTCGSEFERHTYPSWEKQGAKLLYCSVECTNKRPGREAKTARHLLAQSTHPLANAGGRVLAYRAALYDHIGPGAHPCHWCQTPVAWTVRKGPGTFKGDLVVDHLDGNKLNNEVSNLAPACNECNVLRAFMMGWEARHGRDVVTLLGH